MLGNEYLDASLVRIYSEGGKVVGAGFLVGKHHVLTCAHVIVQALDLADKSSDPPSSVIQLDFPQLVLRSQLSAKVIFWCPMQSDGQDDIAILELLDDPPLEAKPIHFVPAQQVWDHSFRALGFPNGYNDGVWATGRLLGRQGTGWIQLEDIKIPGFPVMSGFSGTPVWDMQLQGVVGMIVASSQAATAKTAFVIPSDVLVMSWPQLASLMLPSVLRNPYKGLQAFTEHDTRDFFGREALIEQLVANVEEVLVSEQKKSQRARLLTVLGASGSGKSSVVMAGLLPHLRSGSVFNSSEWAYLDPIVPGTDPLEALAITLKPHFPDISFKVLREDLVDDTSGGLHLLATQLIKKKGDRVILLVDQFEEVFTLTSDEAKRRLFFELLVTAVTKPDGPLFVILTLRADMYDRPMQYPKLFQLIDSQHIPVLSLERDDLRRVIEEPANLPEVQLTFEGGLAEELLVAVQGQSGALPLLQFTLVQFVQRRNGHLLTLDAYYEIGGVKGALSQYAEQIYQDLPSDEHRHIARDIFLRLTRPGVTEQDTTRRRAGRAEFERTDSEQTLQTQEALERFTQARLLTANRVSDTTTIEVSHEALIREWKRLTEWLLEARGDILLQQSLSNDVMEWEKRKQPRDRLYRGVQLKEAQAWVRRNKPSSQELAFLRASVTQQTLSHISLIAIVLLLVSSVGLAGWFSLTQPPSPTLVTTLQDNVNGSLRYCINNAPSRSTIRFAQDLRGTIRLAGGDLVVGSHKQLTVLGPGASRVTISGSSANAVIHIPQGSKLNVSDLSFKDSQTVFSAFLYNEGTLTITRSIISNNKTSTPSTVFGGGIFNYATGTLIVTDSTISGNTANSTGAGNSDNGQGGGIDNEGMLSITNSLIQDNKAISSNGSSLGGGIYSYQTGTVIIANSTISGNTANGNSQGGGIDNEGMLSITNSLIQDNKAIGGNMTNFGAGIFTDLGSKTTVANSIISGNTVSSISSDGGDGGGIDNEGMLTVASSTIRDNKAVGSAGNGGGIYNYTAGSIWLDSSTIVNNSASANKGNSAGGGIDNGGKLTVTNSTILNNKTTSNAISTGGGIWSQAFKKGTYIIIRFSTIYQNTAGDGGGIWVDPTGNSQMTISSSIIAANSAQTGPDISGLLTSGGYNLLQNTTRVNGLDPTTDRQITLSALKIDPTPRNNGGLTQTLRLLPGSSAIGVIPREACHATIVDASGHNMVITTDQRGISRPTESKNTCDIGAYELS